jgi:hypothetical protein
MEKITFINAKGETIEFSNVPPYTVVSIQGTSAADVDHQAQKAPFQDGSTYIDSYLKERPIDIVFEILANNPVELFSLRRQATRILNPKLGPGLLVYEYYGGKNEIAAVPELPLFPDGNGNKGLEYQRGSCSFVAHNPYWNSIEEAEQSLTAWIGKFEFTFEFPVEFGERADRATILNGGDEKTPVIIKFTGPATNPIVTNETTGEWIKVNRILGDGDVLEVNTAFGNKTVEIVSPDGTKTNVFNYIDLESEFFQLIPGENQLSFSSDDIDNVGRVLIKYKNRYLGV